jgi:hypothetical protein
MGEYSEAFVAFDVLKTKHAVAIAVGGRGSEVRFLGEVSRFAGGGGAADPQAGRPLWQAAFLLRGGTDRVRDCIARLRLWGLPAWWSRRR